MTMWALFSQSNKVSRKKKNTSRGETEADSYETTGDDFVSQEERSKTEDNFRKKRELDPLFKL
jgi:hypothetical protein